MCWCVCSFNNQHDKEACCLFPPVNSGAPPGALLPPPQDNGSAPAGDSFQLSPHFLPDLLIIEGLSFVSPAGAEPPAANTCVDSEDVEDGEEVEPVEPISKEEAAERLLVVQFCCFSQNVLRSWCPERLCPV